MSLFGDPSPEREPSRPGGSLPRATIKIRDLNPLCVQIPLEHVDRLMDVAYLCGITPNEDALHYVWRALHKHQLINIETFNENLGPLGLSLELKVSAKHEIQWRGGDYTDRTSAILSTKHRDGSDLGALRNQNDQHPGQDGLLLEIVAGDDLFGPLVASITWDEEVLRSTPGGIRWDFLRNFHGSIKFQEDLPEELPVAPGHHDRFHFLHLEMGTAIVRAERTAQETEPPTTDESLGTKSKSTESHRSRHVTLSLENAPATVIAAILDKTGTLQLPSPWTTATTRLDVVNYLIGLVANPQKFNVDTLMMCEAANPCLVFSLEETSDGESYPATRSTRVSMMDYTGSTGDFSLELTSPEKGVRAVCRWSQGNPRFDDIKWDEIMTLAKPYSRK